jgi:mannan endo-1,4-beta-mannosidase
VSALSRHRPALLALFAVLAIGVALLVGSAQSRAGGPAPGPTIATPGPSARAQASGAAAAALLAQQVRAAERPSTLYYGLSVPGSPSSLGPVDRLAALVGKAPNLIMYYQDFDQGLDSQAARNAHAAGMLPMVTWDPMTTGEQLSNGYDPRFTDARLLAGGYDAYYTSEARAIKALGFPVALRFAHEMNGDWYPWDVNTAGSGNTPALFVALWRHVHDIFTAAGADNVIWVWSPNVTSGASPTPLGELWPGSAYVDWVGLSGYLDITETSFGELYGQTIGELDQVAPRTPWIVTETGSAGPDKVSELNSLFDAVESNPHFIGLIWFDYNDQADWRLEETAAATAAFRAQVSGSRWGSAGT